MTEWTNGEENENKCNTFLTNDREMMFNPFRGGHFCSKHGLHSFKTNINQNKFMNDFVSNNLKLNDTMSLILYFIRLNMHSTQIL